ncbi:MAG: metal ABC transporter permease [Arenicella sp.]
MEDFLIKALIAGLAIAIVCAPLGCFVVWKRMSYFGDSLAHSSLLGIAIGLLIGANLSISILIVSSGFAVLLLWLQQQRLLATDTLLGILSHAAFATGLITISLLDKQNIDIYSYLFGDILSVSNQDLIISFVGGSLILGTLFMTWEKLTLIALNEELAQAEGISVKQMNLLFTLLMSIVVAISIQIVGIILITSMLIIPAAAARQWSRSPQQMAFLSMLIASLAVILGLSVSYFWDIPSGPAIVASASALFALGTITRPIAQ